MTTAREHRAGSGGERGQASLLLLGMIAALLASTLILFSFGQALGTDVMEPHRAAAGCEDKRPARTDVARADDGDGIRFHVAGCLHVAICV